MGEDGLSDGARLRLLEQTWGAGLCRPGPAGDAARAAWDASLSADAWLRGTGPLAARAASACVLACPALGACALLAETWEHESPWATRDITVAGECLPAARRGGACKGRPESRPPLLSAGVAAWIGAVA